MASRMPTKGIVYYTDNRLDPLIMRACQRQLEKARDRYLLDVMAQEGPSLSITALERQRETMPIVSVSLGPLEFGRNIVLNAQRGALTMFRQILAGLVALDCDTVFFAEHDVLYHPDHFEFTPERDDLFYYNQNLWQVDASDGRALYYRSNRTSQLCARHALLLEHYRERVRQVEANGFSNRVGYEPGTHNRPERIDNHWHETWMSETPNIDLRHSQNLTRTRWRRDQFRNQRFTDGWTEADSVPGWGRTRGRMVGFLEEIADG